MIALPWNDHVHLTSLRAFKARSDSTRRPFPPTTVDDKGKVLMLDNDEEEKPLYLDVLPSVPGISVGKDGVEAVKACALMEQGNVLVAVGAREGIWIWRDRSA